MKRRIISILLALCLALTLLPAAAFAAEEGVDNAPAAAGASGGEAAGTGATAEEPQQEQQKAQPEEPEQPQQPEQQPEAKPEPQLEAEGENTPVLLNGEGETTQEVSNASDLTAAIENSAVTTVKLTANIVFDGTLTVTRAVTLDLNGFTLKFTNPDQIPITTYGRTYIYEHKYPIGILVQSQVSQSGQLMLADSSEAATGRLEMTGVNDVAIFVTGGGTLTMTGGRIENQRQMGVWVCASTFTMGGKAVISGCGTAAGSPSFVGGGVLVQYSCAPYEKNDSQRTIISSYFTLEGGAKIENCAARIGGGVCVGDNCLFTMTGGSITGCTALTEGGGVVTEGYGPGSTSEDRKPVFIMSGGSISDCKAGDTYGGTGGGVSVGGMLTGSTTLSAFEMTGGTITGCKAANGGGVNIQGSGTFTMTNGSIADCEALLGGGVELRQANTGVAPTTFTMTGGSITGCKAADTPDNIAGLGGGVYMGSGCQLAMSGNARITGCEAARSGSGIYGTNDASYPWQVPLFTRSDNAQVDKGVSMDYALQVGSGVVDFKTVHMDGLGTEAHPYEIGTADQLKLFRDIVNGTNGQTRNPAACAKLTGNIDLGNEEWTPIGNEPNYNGPGAYSGTFDGDGHTVSGLKVSSAEKYIGLFGQISGATVKNLTVSGKVTGSVVRGGSYAGGIAGYALVSKIINCRNNCQVTGTGIPNQGLVYVGGIVGSAMVSTITDCVNTGAIEMIGGGTSFIGGIAGCLNGTAVSGCSNTGAVSSHGDSQEFEGKAGGITGMTDGTVSGCYNTGSVTILYTGEENSSSAPAAGGIVGWANGEVRDCYNVGAVSATGARTYAGGIAGYRGNGGEVWKAYNVGRVTNTGGVIAAGIAGGNAIGSGVGNIYYLAGSAENGMGVGANGDPNTDDLSLPLSDFANGKVLEEMIGGRGSDETGNPWADTCRYLAAAGKTLPVFKGQGDPHDHAFSKATCTSLAACSCGVTTGALDPSNHPNLKHEPAKAATTSAEGSIEYWYCPDCGKYYKDAKTTQEIGQKDTVTSRLTSGTGGGFPFSGKKDDGKKDDAKTVKSGQTGDPGVALYGAMALLSLTGGTWLVGKKRK